MPAVPDLALQASFLGYLHYAEDIAGIVGGRFGVSDSLVHGIYESVAAPLPAASARGVPSEQVRGLNGLLSEAWGHLVRLEHLTVPHDYDPQVNAVAPRLAFDAVVAAVRALAVVEGVDLAEDPGDALDYAGGRISEGLLPYPWSARCVGCPQAGSVRYEEVDAGPVEVFSSPDPATSEARLAMLLRTTRARVLERAFAEARQRDIRPGRTRRNLRWEEKEYIAGATAPTTLLDVFARLHRRAVEDGGDAFVDGAIDAVEAFRFAEALRLITDATVAALESAIAGITSFELLGDLAASCLRRAEVVSPTMRHRVRAARAVHALLAPAAGGPDQAVLPGQPGPDGQAGLAGDVVPADRPDRSDRPNRQRRSGRSGRPDRPDPDQGQAGQPHPPTGRRHGPRPEPRL